MARIEEVFDEEYSFDKQLEQTRMLVEARRDAQLNPAPTPSPPMAATTTFGTFATTPFTASFAWTPPQPMVAPAPRPQQQFQPSLVEDAMDLDEPDFF